MQSVRRSAAQPRPTLFLGRVGKFSSARRAQTGTGLRTSTLVVCCAVRRLGCDRRGVGMSGVARRRRSVHEAAELSGVVANALLAGAFGQVAELVQEFPDRVALVGGVALAAPIFAGRHLQSSSLSWSSHSAPMRCRM